jgi:hypothetical protein
VSPELRTRRERLLQVDDVRIGPRVQAVAVSKRRLAVSIIFVQLAVFYLILRRDGWVYDDNLILILAGRGGLSWGWLTSLIFQHWGIAYHFVFSLLHSVMPLDHRWALISMLVVLGASIYLYQRIINILFGNAWLAVATGVYFGFSILFVRPLEWLAGGVQYLPNTFFDLLCLYGYIRFEIDGQSRWVILAAGALAGGLLFYEKPAYMLLYLGLIRVLLLSADLRPRALAAVAKSERVMWGALLAVTAAWAIGFRLSGGGTGVAAGSVSVSQYLAYFKILWVQALVPATLDLTIPVGGLSAGQIVTAVVLQLAVLFLLVVSLVRKPSAWRAWVFLIITVAVTGFVVARSRIPEFGVGIGGDPRYLLDFAWLIPLLVCFAFSDRSTLKPALDDPASRVVINRRISLRTGAISLALAAYAVAAVLTTGKLDAGWAGRQALAWDKTAERTLGAMKASASVPILADAPVPFEIVPPAFDPYNRLSWVVPLFSRSVQIDGVLYGPLFTMSATGSVAAASIAARLGDGAVTALAASRQLSVSQAARVTWGHSGVCVTTRGTQASIVRRVDRAPPSITPPYYAMISYTSRYAGAMPMYVDSGNGYPGVTDRYVRVNRGSGTTILFLDSPSPTRLLLGLSPDERLCVSRFDVVTLRTKR